MTEPDNQIVINKFVHVIESKTIKVPVKRLRSHGNVSLIVDKAPAAAQDDAAPIGGIYREVGPLEGVDFAADEPADRRGWAFAYRPHYTTVSKKTIRSSSNHESRTGIRIHGGTDRHSRRRAGPAPNAVQPDGRRTRTSTELSIEAGVTPTTASAHLKRLRGRLCGPTIPDAFDRPTGNTAYLLRRTMSADHRRGYELRSPIQKNPALLINGLRFDSSPVEFAIHPRRGWLPGMDSNHD